MKRRRLFVSPDEISDEDVTFSSKAAHYLSRVLRLKPGDVVEVLDGTRQVIARIDSIRSGEVRGTVLQCCVAPGSGEPHITLAFGCVRPGPFQEILRHGTEMGVSCFVPIISGRVNRRPEQKKERWKSIISAATAQSQRPLLPEIRPPVGFGEFLGTPEHSSLRLVLFSGQGSRPIVQALSESTGWESAVILAGPEGGFTPAEHNEANEAGFVPVSLGRAILRTETACIVAVGAVSLWHGRSTSPNGTM